MKGCPPISTTGPAIERIKRRPDFLLAAKAPSCARGAVVVQARRRDETPLIRVGFTATRKIGGAVVRNRAKRRLREAARLTLPELGRPGYDYVFIARGGAPSRPWARLLDDVKSALIRLAAEEGAKVRDGARAPAEAASDPRRVSDPPVTDLSVSDPPSA